ncbi:MAG: flagellar FlbD family protein [Halarsenatibacteraceae bacterium]
MIKLTNLRGEEIVLNVQMIEMIKATPDTVITLTTDRKILVKEDIDEIIKRVQAYQREIYSSPRIEKG